MLGIHKIGEAIASSHLWTSHPHPQIFRYWEAFRGYIIHPQLCPWSLDRRVLRLLQTSLLLRPSHPSLVTCLQSITLSHKVVITGPRAGVSQTPSILSYRDLVWHSLRNWQVLRYQQCKCLYSWKPNSVGRAFLRSSGFTSRIPVLDTSQSFPFGALFQIEPWLIVCTSLLTHHAVARSMPLNC